MNQIVPAQLEQHDRWVEARRRIERAPAQPARRLLDKRAQYPCIPTVPEVLPMIRVDEMILPQEPSADGELLPRAPKARDIAAEVAAKYELPLRALMSVRRTAPYVLARNEAFYRISIETAMSLPQIGRLFGRDHTTVLYGIRRHAARVGLELPR